MNGIDVSVIVCGYNRREQLLRTCAALTRQDWPRERYEVIVVDNASTDGSPAAVQEFARSAPVEVRCIAEPRPGKVHALNTGLAAARGRIVAFTDDDCEPRPDWLATLVACLDDPCVGLVGGPVPSHFPAHVETDPEKRFIARKFLADFSLGDEKRDLRGRESPLGCNMAVRVEALRRAGGFSPLLGPSPATWGDHEDSDLAWRIRDSGYRLVYEPAAIVDHYPDSERLSPAVIRSRAAAIGRCGYLSRQRGPVPCWRKCVRTAGFSLELVLRLLRWVVCAPISRKRFVAEYRLRGCVGKLAAVWARRKEDRSRETMP